MIERIIKKNEIGTAGPEADGLYIHDIYGREKSGRLFYCLFKGLTMFMICIGLVTGFSDAFLLDYDKTALTVFTLALSLTFSFFLEKIIAFAAGFAVLCCFIVFCVYKFAIYVYFGFMIVVNTVGDTYSSFYGLPVLENSYELYEGTDPCLSVTITLIIIVSVLMILFNITVSRYLNFLETLFISLPFIEIPMFIGLKPGIVSISLFILGMFCIYVFKNTSFGNEASSAPRKKKFIEKNKSGRKFYTLFNNYILLMYIFIFLAVVMLGTGFIGKKAYEKSLGESSENSLREHSDELVKFVIDNGLYSLFDGIGGNQQVQRGKLGNVAFVIPNNDKDIKVTFVPYSNENVYLAGFKGFIYNNNKWENSVSYNDLFRNEIKDKIFSQNAFDILDRYILALTIDKGYSNVSEMQIEFLDKNVDMGLCPYYPADEEAIYNSGSSDPNDKTLSAVGENTKKVIKYYTPEKSVFNKKDSSYYSYYPDQYVRMNMGRVFEGEMIDYDLYINRLCLTVPENISEYLDSFIDEHGLKTENNNVQTLYGQEARDYVFSKSITFDNLAELEEFFSSDYIPVITSDRPFDDELINKSRLETCEAIRDIFMKEYSYSLYPGKTPEGEDFVEYFLKTQKKGLCGHFATAAVLLLRKLGIPAKYAEGYVIPNSLVKESAVKDNNDDEAVSVEVGNKYAHSWVEVYLNGQGFVPFEMTPSMYTLDSGDTNNTTENEKKEDDISDREDSEINENEDKNEKENEEEIIEETDDEAVKGKAGIVLTVSGVLIVFAAAFLFIFKRKRMKNAACRIIDRNYRARILKEYNKLVKKLKKRKIINAENPLPMEVCKAVAEYKTAEIIKEKTAQSKRNGKDKGYKSGYKKNTDRKMTVGSAENESNHTEESLKIYTRFNARYTGMFSYMEKVLYSDYKTNEEEFGIFYKKLMKI